MRCLLWLTLLCSHDLTVLWLAMGPIWSKSDPLTLEIKSWIILGMSGEARWIEEVFSFIQGLCQVYSHDLHKESGSGLDPPCLQGKIFSSNS